MLSYQHLYHAGCLADVHKHMALVAVLRDLLAQKKPLSYIETHAGRGLYDLSSPEAEKTGEARAGILRLLEEGRIPAGSYLDLLRKTQAKYGKMAYPGSPLIAQMLLRSMDMLHLMELHPREYAALRDNMHGRNLDIQQRDGYAVAMAISPPIPRDGLVLIDPSFEVKQEYEQAADFVLSLHRKWPEAVIMLWYPMLKAGLFKDMAETVEQAGLPGFHRHETVFYDPAEVRGMYGSGLVAVNLPQAVVSALEEAEGLLAS